MQHRASGTPVAGRTHEAAVYLLSPGFTVAPDARGGGAALEALLDLPELERADQFVRAADRQRFVIAHALLRIAVAHHLGVPRGAPQFDFACIRCGAQHGPPRLVGGVPPGSGPIAVSLSRSSGAVAVAVLTVSPVTAESATLSLPAVPVQLGVDVERVAAVGFAEFDAVALSAGERAGLTAADLRARADLWVQKEAIAKALGSGLRRDPAEIQTSRGVSDENVVCRLVELGGEPASSAARRSAHGGFADYRAAIAVAPAEATDTIVYTLVSAEPLVRAAIEG